MKIKSNTLILLVVAVLFAGGVYLFEQHQTQQTDTEEAESGEPLFEFSEDQVIALTVNTPDLEIVFET